MLTCNDAYGLIVRTIDDPRISGEKRAALRQHLVSCARCRDEYDTQHEVRRLLALHIQDQLPAGFDDRLRARLAQTSRPEASRRLSFGVLRETPAPSVARRLLDVQDDRRHDTRGRTWALRLIPLAATLALIAAGTSMRDSAMPTSVVSSDASTDTQSGTQSDVHGASPGQPRAFTTIVIKRDDGATQRQRPAAASTEDVAHVPASSPAADDDLPHGSGAVADSGIAADDASRTPAARAAKEVPRTSDITERVPAAAPRAQDRERVASRERATTRERDVRGERDAEDERDARRERAASQRPGILPRPATPFPQARPAMPAPGPPAVVPDRTIPPW
jgi:hypothetical protein